MPAFAYLGLGADPSAWFAARGSTETNRELGLKRHLRLLAYGNLLSLLEFNYPSDLFGVQTLNPILASHSLDSQRQDLRCDSRSSQSL